MQLFGRIAEIVVADIEVSGLRVAFDIERSLARNPNKAEIKIWNLSDDTRRSIETTRRPRVRVRAGYIDGTSSIFFGGLREVRSQIEGSDIVTTLSGVDGGHQLQTARTSRSHAGGTTYADVISGLANDLRVGVGNAVEAFRERGAGAALETFFEGTVTHGPAAQELDGLVRSRNLEWSVQDESLQVLPRGRALAGEALVVSAATGMIGTPSISNHGVVTLETFMIPDVFPGRRISMESRFITGAFRIAKCQYVGDTHGKDWKIKIEARSETRQARTRVPAGASEDSEE